MAQSRSSRSGNHLVVGVVLSLTAALFVAAPGAAASGTTVRVSVTSDGAEGNNSSHDPAVTPDGRYLAFNSFAPLVPNDINTGDVFVRDNQTGAVTLVSVASDGTQGNGPSWMADISANGRFVSFYSRATNLVPGDTNDADDVFVHDRQTGATTRVSVGPAGIQANASSRDPVISADGRHVAFTSAAGNLVVPDVNAIQDVFVHDRQTGVTSLVNVSTEGAQGVGVSSATPAISADGNYVAFFSDAPNLVVGDTNAASDVFVRDRAAGTTTRVSVASDGSQTVGASSAPAISANGRYVTFTSTGSTLVAGDTNSAADVFVHDRQTAATTRVSVASGGGQGNSVSGVNVTATSPISADGRYVAFPSAASNLVTGDKNGDHDVFVHDRQTNSTTRVSVSTSGVEGNAGTPVLGIALTANGRQVVFDSYASNLVENDQNRSADVFVHDTTGGGSRPLVSVGDVAVHEGDSGSRAAVFTVSLSTPAADPVTVAYATAKGSAVGTDFTARTGTLSFAPGVTSLLVKVPVTPDEVDEGNESFTLGLSLPTGATIGDATGVGTILDDDPATIIGRRLSIGDVSVHEGDAGARVAVFNVSLSRASTGYVTASFATAKGTAIGTDFAAKSGTVSFSPGATSMNVKVAITPDTVAEGDESFTVTLSNAAGATIADATGAGTIIDND